MHNQSRDRPILAIDAKASSSAVGLQMFIEAFMKIVVHRHDLKTRKQTQIGLTWQTYSDIVFGAIVLERTTFVLLVLGSTHVHLYIALNYRF